MNRLINTRNVKLSMQERVLIAVRTLLETLPLGIGSAINQGYFGTIDERRMKRIELFLNEFAQEMQKSDLELKKIKKSFFRTDEFAYLFENVLRRVNTEVKKEKLKALRGALLSIIIDSHKLEFDKKSHFLKTIDLFEALHIQVLQLLASHYKKNGDSRYVSFDEVCTLLNAKNESSRSFVYSILDTLANKEFILSGPIPFDKDGKIDKPKQRFRASALGIDFLEFIRMSF